MGTRTGFGARSRGRAQLSQPWLVLWTHLTRVAAYVSRRLILIVQCANVSIERVIVIFVVGVGAVDVAAAAPHTLSVADCNGIPTWTVAPSPLLHRHKNSSCVFCLLTQLR